MFHFFLATLTVSQSIYFFCLQPLQATRETHPFPQSLFCLWFAQTGVDLLALSLYLWSLKGTKSNTPAVRALYLDLCRDTIKLVSCTSQIKRFYCWAHGVLLGTQSISSTSPHPSAVSFSVHKSHSLSIKKSLCSSPDLSSVLSVCYHVATRFQGKVSRNVREAVPSRKPDTTPDRIKMSTFQSLMIRWWFRGQAGVESSGCQG